MMMMTPLLLLFFLVDAQDTRTHAIGELYDTERSYVESLQILVTVCPCLLFNPSIHPQRHNSLIFLSVVPGVSSQKYLQPLKSSPECSGLVEGTLVDEIFYQVLHLSIESIKEKEGDPFRGEKQIPAILAHHEVFLEELRKRLESWDSQQCVGGVFLEAVS